MIDIVTLNHTNNDNYTCSIHLPAAATDETLYQSNNSSEQLIILVSPRVTHQIISRIYAIVLRDYFNYGHGIELRMVNQSDPVAAASAIAEWTVRTIDLEYWLTPDFYMWKNNVMGSGITTDFGRIGWFIPKKLIGPK